MKLKFITLACSALLGMTTLQADTLSSIRDKGVIRIGVSEHMAPFSVLQSDGSFKGFEIDFSKEIAKAVLGENGTIEFIGVPQGERLDYVKNNKVDILIAAYTRNPERAKVADFSIPYFSITLATVSKKSDKIHSVGDLNGKRVLVINESNSDIWVRKNPNLIPVPCQNNRDCYNKLKNGEGDAYMHNITSVASIPLLDTDYEVGIQRIGEVFFDCVTTQKGNSDLISIIDNKILDLSNEGFFLKNYNDTFEPFFKGSISSKYFLLEDLYAAFQ